MLHEVYGRAARTRRRRQATAVLGAAAATLLAATALSLVDGGRDEARLRVIDEGEKTQTEGEQPADVQTTDEGDQDTGTPGRPPSSDEADPSGRRHEAALPPPADGVRTAPTVTTTTTVPPIRLLAQVEDAAGDAHPNDWYLDVVRGAVQLDDARGVLVFTTTFRSAGAGTGTRNEHTMTSEVQYDNSVYAVTVVEQDNELGEPELDEGSCAGCTASFDLSAARLTVTVPLATFNAAVAARGSGNPPFQSSSVVDDLVVLTELSSGITAVDADSSRNSEVQP
jgi:hypothetical protein